MKLLRTKVQSYSFLADLTNSKIIGHTKQIAKNPDVVVTLNLTDISQTELRVIDPKVKIRSLNFETADKLALIPDKSVNLFIANLTDNHDFKFDHLLNEAHRILNRHGIFIFATFSRTSKAYVEIYAKHLKDNLYDIEIADKLLDMDLFDFISVKEHLFQVNQENDFIDCNIFFVATETMVNEMALLLEDMQAEAENPYEIITKDDYHHLIEEENKVENTEEDDEIETEEKTEVETEKPEAEEKAEIETEKPEPEVEEKAEVEIEEPEVEEKAEVEIEEPEVEEKAEAETEEPEVEEKAEVETEKPEVEEKVEVETEEPEVEEKAEVETEEPEVEEKAEVETEAPEVEEKAEVETEAPEVEEKAELETHQDQKEKVEIAEQDKEPEQDEEETEQGGESEQDKSEEKEKDEKPVDEDESDHPPTFKLR